MPTPPKRILVVSVDPAEAPFRLRLAILQDLLGPEGYEFDFRPRPKDYRERGRLVATANQYAAVILQRKLLDPSQARLLRRRAKRVLYDIDDAVMGQRRKIGLMSRWLKHRRYIATARALDHVVAGNEYLADMFRQLGCTATVLPTVVDPQHYRVKAHVSTTSPTLVWIGSRSTLPYLQQSLPSLEAAAKEVPGLRLLTIANDTVQSDVIPVEHVPWSLEAEAEALHRGDIGIAPTPLDQWTIGKCGFKIIQYMATGLPSIASPVGANRQIVENGTTGLWADTMEEWTAAVVKLANDVDLRREMGTVARATVERQYSLDQAKRVWSGLLNDV